MRSATRTEQNFGHGWKLRMGYISGQSASESVISQFYRIVPEGVTMVYTCLGIRELVPSEWEAAGPRIGEAAKELARRKVDVIVVGGSPLVIPYGKGRDKRIIDDIQKATGVPTTTDVTAAVDAMNALSIKKVVVVSPMAEDLSTMMKKFLEDSGFKVLNNKCLGLPLLEAERIPLHVSYKLAKDAFLEAPEADGIYCFGCCNTFAENIQRLEKEIKKPVVHTIIDIIWKAFSLANLREPIRGYGRLLETL